MCAVTEQGWLCAVEGVRLAVLRGRGGCVAGVDSLKWLRCLLYVLADTHKGVCTCLTDIPLAWRSHLEDSEMGSKGQAIAVWVLVGQGNRAHTRMHRHAAGCCLLSLGLCAWSHCNVLMCGECGPGLVAVTLQGGRGIHLA